jgi:hypothetical protein
MINSHLGRIFLSPDAGGGDSGGMGPLGGTDAFGGSDQSGALTALLQGGNAAGTDPLGGPAEEISTVGSGENPMGSFDKGPKGRQGGQVKAGDTANPEGDEDGDQSGRDTSIPKGAQVLPRKKADAAPDAKMTIRDLSAEDRGMVEARYSKREIDRQLARFGQDGLDAMMEEAEAYLEEHGDLDDEQDGQEQPQRGRQGDQKPRDGAEEAEEQDDQDAEDDDLEGDDDDQPANDEREEAKPKRRPEPRQREEQTQQQPRNKTGQFDHIRPTKEALDSLRNNLGDETYKGVVVPLVKAANRSIESERRLNAATERIEALITHYNATQKTHADNYINMHLDRLDDERLGSSYEGLGKSQLALRSQVAKHTAAELRRNPRAGLAQAIRFGVAAATRNAATKKAAKRGGAHAGAGVPNGQRRGQNGTPRTMAGGGQPGPQGLGAAFNILSTGLPIMRNG